VLVWVLEMIFKVFLFRC